jgi:hypothetical protein
LITHAGVALADGSAAAENGNRLPVPALLDEQPPQVVVRVEVPPV